MNINYGKGVALFLCDYTGKMAEPWLKDGYHCVLIDPQHAPGIHTDGMVTRIGCIISEALGYIGSLLRGGYGGYIAFVAGFPPCTDVAVSGARWFELKASKDKYFQVRAALVAKECQMIGELSGAPWFFENPVSVFSAIFGKPQHIFDPSDFTGFCPQDNYTKKTCLWVGGGFVMPKSCRNFALGPPDDRIHKAPPGPDRANFRSATPLGFARAVHMANRNKHWMANW